MATAAESSSSTEDLESITASTSSVDGRGRAAFGSSSARRRIGSSLMRRSSFLAGEVSALPEIGERTIYVTDDGLIVSTNNIVDDHDIVGNDRFRSP